ncbi:rho guanine nucleotide exchange factor 37 isoform X2 [Pseudoliparis swirei]|uniref:rho guanine nucleotide exchange factor 37 isoform X2 n=1 Tax=Pseudoliparis swirei TaxID=2059687 RepID=UPI0024BE3590|nr:rho guanine nucleotide exchange factor 37 isoform X2 [Pseudoliparis swirei]
MKTVTSDWLKTCRPIGSRPGQCLLCSRFLLQSGRNKKRERERERLTTAASSTRHKPRPHGGPREAAARLLHHGSATRRLERPEEGGERPRRRRGGGGRRHLRRGRGARRVGRGLRARRGKRAAFLAGGERGGGGAAVGRGGEEEERRGGGGGQGEGRAEAGAGHRGAGPIGEELPAAAAAQHRDHQEQPAGAPASSCRPGQRVPRHRRRHRRVQPPPRPAGPAAAAARRPSLPGGAVFLFRVRWRLKSLRVSSPVSPPPCLLLRVSSPGESFLRLSPDIEASYREYLTRYSQVTLLENSYKQDEALWNRVAGRERHVSELLPGDAGAAHRPLPAAAADHPEAHGDEPPGLRPPGARHPHRHRPQLPHQRVQALQRTDKYKKTETLTMKDKIYRLNSHSIAKKTARFSQHFKHETGMAPKLVDEEFDALEGFFYVLEHGILELLDNVETYLYHLQGFLSCRTEEFELDLDGETAPTCYKEVTAALRQWVLPTFEKRMRTLIHKPLGALRDLLPGPRNLIRKRLDKLLDYELLEAKSTLSYEEQDVANTYRTINTLLLTELPQFSGVALQVMCGALEAFSVLHRDLAADMQQLLQSFAQQLPHSSLERDAFREWAESAVLEGARRLETLCRSVELTLSAPAVQPLSPSSRRRLQQLTEKHGSGKIYQVVAAAVASRDLDLNLARGELVAVISAADTRGDKRRWLVDAGGPRGYAPSSKLIRYHQPTEDPPPSPHLTLPDGVTGIRRHSYTPESQPLTVMSQPCLQVLAAYDFTASGTHEVSVRAGEPVRVLEPRDKRGNPDWSLVEARGGRRGYVPSNYLAVAPLGAGTR